MTTKQADTLVKQLLAALEKSYSRASLFDVDDPLDQVSYLIIEGMSGKKAAEAGVRRLSKTFVDWNEVRVSSEREIEGCLTEVRKEDKSTTAANIKSGLEYLYEARYREEFDLSNPCEFPDQALQILSGIEGLDLGRAALVLHSQIRNEENFIPFASVGRILMRVGAIKKTTSLKTIIASVNELVLPEEMPRLTYLLARHGHEVCGVKSYYCTQCKAVSLCAMGRRRVKTARRKKTKASQSCPDTS